MLSGMGWQIAGVVVLLGAVVAIGRAPAGERADRLQSFGWALGAAAVVYIAWWRFTASDVTSFAAWAIGGEGRVLLGLSFVGFGAYVFQESARQTDDPSRLIELMQQRSADALRRPIGILAAILVAGGTAAFATGSALADILGLLGGMLGEAPLIISQLVTIVLGGVSLGWDLPLIGDLLPAWLTDMPPSWWFGVTLLILGIAVGIRETGAD